MQKKLLASLLVVPMVYSAFADISVDLTTGEWVPDGNVGDGYSAEATKVTSSVGVASVSKKFTFYTGNYKLTFATESNTSVLVIVNGDTIPTKVSDDKLTTTFSIGEEYANKAGQVTFELIVKAANVSEGFEFTGLTLGIECDFQIIGETLAERLASAPDLNDTLDLKEIGPDFPAAADVIAKLKADSAAFGVQYKELSDSLAHLKDTIAGITALQNYTGKDADSLKLDAYGKYKLYNFTPNDEAVKDSATVVDSTIIYLLKKIDEYNDSFDKYNAFVENYPKNVAKHTLDTTALKKYRDSIADLKATEIKDNKAQTDYIQSVIAKPCLSADTAIEAFADSITKNYANLATADTEIAYDSKNEIEAIEAKLQAVNDAIASAKKDIAARDTIMELSDSIFNIYTEAFSKLDSLKADTRYVAEAKTDPVKAIVNKVKQQITTRYTKFTNACSTGYANAEKNLDSARKVGAELKQYIETLAGIGVANGNGIQGLKDTIAAENDSMAAFWKAYYVPATDTTKASGVLAEYNKTANLLDTITSLSDAVKADYQAKLPKINTLLNNFKTSVFEAYDTLSWPAYDKYTASLKEITDSLKAFNSISGLANLKDSLDHQKELLSQGDYVITFVGSKNDTTKTNLAKTFANTFTNLQNAIDNLNPDAANYQTQLNAIQTQIANIKANADKVRGFFHGLDTVFGNYTKAIALVNDTIVADKAKVLEAPTLIKGHKYYDTESVKESTEYTTGLIAPYNSLEAGIKAAMAARDNASFTQFQTLWNDVFASADGSLKDTYNYPSNSKAIEKLLNDSIAKADVKTAGIAADSVGNIKTPAALNKLAIADLLNKYEGVIDEVNDKVVALNAEAFDAETYTYVPYNNAIDSCKLTIDSLVMLKDAIATCIKIEKTKADLDKKIATNDSLLAVAKNLDTKNIWADTIASLTAASTSLSNSLKAAYDSAEFKAGTMEMTDPDKNLGVADVEKNLSDSTTIVKGAAEGLIKAINTSLQNQAQLKTISSGVRNYITSGIATLTDKQAEIATSDTTGLATQIDAWIDTLNTLLVSATEPGNIMAIDADVTNAFNNRELGDGQSLTKFTDKYEAVENAAKAIMNQFDTKINELVKNYNEPIIKNLQNVAINTQSAYSYAVKEYNQYVTTVTNKGYLNFEDNSTTVKAVINNQNDLYAILEKYQAQNDSLKKFIAAANSSSNVISQEVVKEFTDSFAKIDNAIWANVVNMQTTVGTIAQAYYADRHQYVDDSITNAIAYLKSKLSEANAKEAVNLTNAPALLLGADTLYDKINKVYTANLALTTDEAKAKAIEFGLEMNTVAERLEKAQIAIEGFSADAFATKLWANDLKKGNDSINKLITKIQNVKDSTYCYAPDSVKEKALDSLDVRLDSVAVLPKNIKLDELEALQQKLEDILTKAYNDAKAVADVSKVNLDAAKLVEDYQKNLDSLQTSYNTIADKVIPVAAGNMASLAPAKTSLDNYLAAFEEHKGELKNEDYQKSIDSIADSFRTQAMDAINTTAAAEIDLLKDTWYNKLVVAYNNASVYTPDSVMTDSLKAVLANANKFIQGLDTIVPEWKAITYDVVITTDSLNLDIAKGVTFADSARKVEKKISTLYQQLCAMWEEGTDNNGDTITSPDPVADANAIINDAKAAAEAAIAEYKATLKASPASVQSKFEAKPAEYDSLMTVADNVVAAAADRVIINPESYAGEYAQLEAQVNADLEVLKAAKEKAEAELARIEAVEGSAKELNDALDDYAAEIAALKETVKGYDTALGDKTTIADAVNPELDKLVDEIGTEKEAVAAALQSALESTTADTVAYKITGNYADAIAAQALVAAKAYANGSEAVANDSVNNIAKIIRGLELANNDSIINKLTALEATQTQLVDSLAKLNANTAATAKEYVAIATANFELIDDLKALLEEAKENEFVLGDVNLNPDGKVDISDVTLLMEWIGEKLTYEQLADSLGARVAAAADINGDGKLNVADLVAEINLAIGKETNTPALASRKIHAAAGVISIDRLAIKDEVTRYAIRIDSKFTFVGGVIDINLPEGTELVGTELAGASHKVVRFDNENDIRLIIVNFNNAEIDMNGNVVLYIDVKGALPEISVGQFADKNAALYNLTVKNLSGIEGINAVEGTMGQRIYNVAGQTMRAIQRGINIIRNADGTTTKEYHK